MDVEEWLANIYKTDVANIKNILKNERATTFLMVWSVYEQEIFNGYMKKEKISCAAKKYSRFFDLLDIEQAANSFHTRFQDKKKFQHLIHNEKDVSEFEKNLSKPYEELSREEKLYLLFYVSYRYRNNIFHGNKGVLAWEKYTQQIDDCIIFMTRIITKVKGSVINCETI